MLRFLLSIVRSPQPKAARRRAVAMLSVAAIGTAITFVWLSIAVGGYAADGFVALVVLAAGYLVIVIAVAGQVFGFIWPRRMRQAFLRQRGDGGFAVFLSDELRSYFEGAHHAAIGGLAESVSIVHNSHVLEVWAGGRAPKRVATLSRDEVTFMRPERTSEGLTVLAVGLGQRAVTFQFAGRLLGIDNDAPLRAITEWQPVLPEDPSSD
jgi:hypothetical protein